MKKQLSSKTDTSINFRRLKLAESIILFSTGVALVWSILMYFLKINILGNYISISVLVFAASYLVFKKYSDLLGRIIFLINGNLIITINASFADRAGGVEFILCFVIGLPFILFSWKKELQYLIVFSAFTVSLWVALIITDFHLFTSRHYDSEIAYNIIYPLSVASTLLLTMFQTIYFHYLNSGYEKDLKDKKIEAEELLSAKAQFLSTMSHEIRTPLNAVVALSYLLKNSEPKPEQVENIDALNYSGKSLLTLINDVLDFNKIEGKHVLLEEIPSNIKMIAKQLSKIHEPLCIRKGIYFEVEIDDNIGPLLMDPARTNQVLNNLVSNAIKFTDIGGITLKISSIEETDETNTVLFEIKDTGIGISEENFIKIFDPFSQANVNTTRLYGGTGLGLPIVKKIIELMKGEIKLKSEVDKGSVFYFTLELKKATDADTIDNENIEMLPFKGEKVLLVEDNAINVMVCKQILSRWNLSIDVAVNGQEAVDMVKNGDYKVVLMDIQMPIKNGYDASVEIRTFNKEVPILALSASVFVEVKDKIFNCGMNGFIYKPFDPQDLYNKIAACINKDLLI